MHDLGHWLVSIGKVIINSIIILCLILKVYCLKKEVSCMQSLDIFLQLADMSILLGATITGIIAGICYQQKKMNWVVVTIEQAVTVVHSMLFVLGCYQV